MPDRLIRITTGLVVVGVAVVAAIVSYEHAYELVRAHGEDGWTARLVPLTVDGLIYSSSMAMLQSARRQVRCTSVGGVAAGAWHRGNARRECPARTRPRPDRRGSGGLACLGAGGQL